MDLVVNGQPHRHSGQGTIPELLQECQADAARTAVMVNSEVVPRARWDSARLCESDHVEILVFVGGG